VFFRRIKKQGCYHCRIKIELGAPIKPDNEGDAKNVKITGQKGYHSGRLKEEPAVKKNNEHHEQNGDQLFQRSCKAMKNMG
jgi:hypothetical protein